ncbi:alpha-tubulin N-acetyltransferase 1-like [Eurosta solidaginis]|uniref:alpha-tubulin N-acetyltransferase 1-like n=1 Tax=Eurosta solidaginis TaxID=178769 RepID=UPI00353081F3
MATFQYDLRQLFPQPIIKITSTLLPHKFRGDHRQAADIAAKISKIIDRMGELSAIAQKLNKPVTTAQKLRMSDNHVVYLMADLAKDGDGRRGEVTGLLKIGFKDLYLFDELGQARKVDKTPCILDFYIHDSRQRTGLGKVLFQTMLSEEKWVPVKCSVDRPSEKLLSFLKKHYGLERCIPQANHFVLYDGFFEHEKGNEKASELARSRRMLLANR